MPSAASVAWRPLGYFLFALSWTIVAACVLGMWVLVGGWLLTPAEPAPLFADVGGTVIAVLLLSPALGILVLAVPATLSEAAFGWSFFVRALGPGDRTRALSANVGGTRYPLLAPTAPSVVERRILVVFDASWSPNPRVALVALIVGLGVVGLTVVRGASVWIGVIWLLVVVVALVFTVRRAAAAVRREAEKTIDEPGRAARSAARYARIARKREARRVELVALRRDDPEAFAAALLAEVDAEVVKRVHLVRRIKRGQTDAADILVGNVIHSMVGSVDDAEVRPLVLRRAREIVPAPRPPRKRA